MYRSTLDVTHELKSAVWWKGTQVPGNDPKVWMQDRYGAWMKWAEYGNRDSVYGWEIDHIDPNGGNSLSNLQPLQWKNNVLKSDS